MDGPTRYFAYYALLLSGAMVLVLEIVGARLLTPYFGSSYFVWVAQLIVTLAALGCGYFLGGWLGQIRPELSTLAYLLLGASTWTYLARLLWKPVAIFFLRLPIEVGTILTSVVLFFVPLCLFSTASPFLSQLFVRDVSAVSRQIGKLIALSTVGSLIGTVIVSFFLIPYFRYTTILALGAGVVFLSVFLYAIPFDKKLIYRTAAIFVPFLVSEISAIAYGGVLAKTLPFQIQSYPSAYGVLHVLTDEETDNRVLVQDLVVVSAYKPKAQLPANEIDHALEFLAKQCGSRLSNALILGVGAGMLARSLDRSGSQIDIVEINPKMLNIAREKFDLDLSRMSVHTEDARTFLLRDHRQYDAIFLDAFVSESPPWHLLSQEAFQAIHSRLAPGGCLIVNFSDRPSDPDRFAMASVAKTLATVSTSIQVHATDRLNRLFVVAKGDIQNLPTDLSGVPSHLRQAVRKILQSRVPIDFAKGILITDEDGQAEAKDARAQVRFRQALALSKPAFRLLD